MIAEPENARSRRTRSAVLAAARDLIAERGFADTSMAAVAERSGVTRRAVYLHFPNRTALLAAVVDEVSDTEGLAASTARVWSAPDAVTALREWARHVARFHPRVLEIDLAAEAERHHDPEAAAHRSRVVADQRSACKRLVGRLADEGLLAPHWSRRAAVDLVWSMLAPGFLHALLIDCAWSPAELGRRLGDVLTNTLVLRPL